MDTKAASHFEERAGERKSYLLGRALRFYSTSFTVSPLLPSFGVVDDNDDSDDWALIKLCKKPVLSISNGPPDQSHKTSNSSVEFLFPQRLRIATKSDEVHRLLLHVVPMRTRMGRTGSIV